MSLRSFVILILERFEALAQYSTTKIDDAAVYMIRKIVENEALYALLIELLNISGQEARQKALDSEEKYAPVREFASNYAGTLPGSIDWLKVITTFAGLCRAYLNVYNVDLIGGK
ncbi:hypothetical protein KC887_00425 [Candidatus Kaiserbacteria bacterium]|nr:hypothetical protein [Candidatus Kaiserbacteria bacterium]